MLNKIFNVETVDVKGRDYFNVKGQLLADMIGDILDAAWEAAGGHGKRPANSGILFSKLGAAPVVSFRATDVEASKPRKAPAKPTAEAKLSAEDRETAEQWAAAIVAGDCEMTHAAETLADYPDVWNAVLDIVAEMKARKAGMAPRPGVRKAPPSPAGKVAAAQEATIVKRGPGRPRKVA